MKISQAIKLCLSYHAANSQKNTLTCYQHILSKFRAEFEKRDISSITQDDILPFLTCITEGNKRL